MKGYGSREEIKQGELGERQLVGKSHELLAGTRSKTGKAGRGHTEGFLLVKYLFASTCVA
jgi:hypothetical protein